MAKFQSFIKEREQPEFEELHCQQNEIQCTSEDQIFLEDESGKIELDHSSVFANSMNLKLSVHSFNTGNFIRVSGEMLPSYKFFVREIHLLHDQSP